MAGSLADLDAFAEANPSTRGMPCWVCTVPEREAIEAGHAKGRTLGTILGSGSV
jgi:hypothetical protein